ncbi:hypothetical protein G9A89_020630, partial [Geosiphon pyriformis]
MNAHNIWDFIGSMGGKTCVINCHPIMYAWAKCAVICFDSAEFLDAAMNTTPVLRSMNLHWFYLGFSKYAKYRKISHMLLGCFVNENISSGRFFHRILSDIDKSRLATIYAKRLASVACSVVFGGVSWTKTAGESLFPPLFVHSSLVNSGFSSEMKSILPVMIDIKKRFAVLESSLTSLTGQINKLAKKLDSLMPAMLVA